MADDCRRRLEEVPDEVWQYQLGNRSAIEWVVDQFSEASPKDSTIKDMFNEYKFCNYKSKVIDLLMRVTTVSVEKVKIVSDM